MEWLWPVCCVGCGTAGVRLCLACGPGTVLRPGLHPPGVDGVISLERYERPLGQALRNAKVASDRGRVVRLSQLFVQGMQPALEGCRVDAIVPAPSTLWTRLRRGFATASVFAHRLGQALDVPVVHALRSTAKTRLATLDQQSRRRALEGRIRSIRDVPGRVLLVDDVLTTGSTAEACAMELLGGTTDRVMLATLCVVTAHKPI